MKNNSVSNSVMMEMNDRMQSEEHLSLFNGVYKLASEKCKECSCAPCKCDSAMAKDNDSSKKEDSNDAQTAAIWGGADAAAADDSDEDESDADDSSDESDADDMDEEDESKADDASGLNAGRYDADGS